MFCESVERRVGEHRTRNIYHANTLQIVPDALPSHSQPPRLPHMAHLPLMHTTRIVHTFPHLIFSLCSPPFYPYRLASKKAFAKPVGVILRSICLFFPGGIQ